MTDPTGNALRAVKWNGVNEATTTEGRLADIIDEGHGVFLGQYKLSKADTAKVVSALRSAAMGK